MLLLLYRRNVPMPCPLFIPGSPMPGTGQVAAPLGDIFNGHCSASPDYIVPESLLRSGCNLGYARGQCAIARQSPDDATCFVISRIAPDQIEVRWALERDHHPVAVGEFTVVPNAAEASSAIHAQALAYVGVYKRRT